MRVMTFNILHDAVRNLNSPWPERRHAVATTIRAADPDVACLQEVSSRQLDQIRHDLPEFELIPGLSTGLTRVPRFATGLIKVTRPIFGDYLERGESCPVLVRKGRVAVLDRGSIRMRFSESELGPAWADSPTPHVITWARVQGRGPEATVYNTHLGILPWNWKRTARELLLLLGREWRGNSQILVGDFNALPGGSLLRLLRNGGKDRSQAFQDAWRTAKTLEGPRNTFHFGKGWNGPRLDYIMVRPRATVVKAMTLGGRTGRVFPSDHYAVAADLDLTR